MQAARSRGLHSSRRVQAQFLYGLLTHAVFLDLAGDGHGEFVGQLDVARYLVVGDLAPAEVAD